MLVVRNPEYLARVVRFARNTDQIAQLTEALWYLHTYAERSAATPCVAPEPIAESGIPASWMPHASGKRNVCTLLADFAPASFEVIWSIGMVGGLIYHGNQAGWSDSDTYQEPFSVRLGRSDNPWSVHT